MIRLTSQFFVRLMEKYLPDPYLFATILTFVTFICAAILTPASPLKLIDFWAEGLWSLLAFTMQMCIVIVTGGALVRTTPVRKCLTKLTSYVKTPKQAYASIALIAGIASLVSWGIGLIVGAFVAKQMALRVKRTHFPLLVAAAYSGFVVWHMGYTSSIGLLIATKGHPLENLMGVIPITETIMAPYNIITAILVLITLPILMIFMAPKEGDHIVTAEASALFKSSDELSASIEPALTPTTKPTLAEKIEHLRIINIIIAAIGIIYFIRYFMNSGTLDLNIVNFSFLILGILLSKTPIEYVEHIAESSKSLGPIVLQFPFYGGIMGIMTQSGLAGVIAGAFVAISSAATLPFWSFISAGILNIFIPSGGGQWAVQGPIMIEAAKQLGADLPKVAMSVAWGDQWTNMIQPFWALPALAIVGLKAKDIMGYCVITLIATGILFSIGMLFL